MRSVCPLSPPMARVCVVAVRLAMYSALPYRLDVAHKSTCIVCIATYRGPDAGPPRVLLESSSPTNDYCARRAQAVAMTHRGSRPRGHLRLDPLHRPRPHAELGGDLVHPEVALCAFTAQSFHTAWVTSGPFAIAERTIPRGGLVASRAPIARPPADRDRSRPG